MSDQWYFMRSGEKIGPVSLEVFQGIISRREVQDNDAVWTPGLPGWVPLAQVRDRVFPKREDDLLASLGIASMDLGISTSAPAKRPAPTYAMEPGDRVARALFVAVAVGIAWGIRGDFGHLLGAMYPGAVLLLGLAYVSGQASALRSMPVLAAASALGIGLGGNMSYGLLHGYAQADTFVNYSYGFLTLLLLGGAWGCYGGALVGMILERDRATWTDWAGGAGVAFLSGLALYWLVHEAFGFDINPDRDNGALTHVGGCIGLFVWLSIRKLPIALRASMLGFVGFGLGMAGGRLVGNLFHNMESMFMINHWNVMEISCGMIGGFIFTFGMLGTRFRDRASNRNLTLWDGVGAIFVLGGIPLLHRLIRIDEKDVGAWNEKLASFGSTWTSDSILTSLHVVIVLAFIGVGVWLYLQYSDREGWGAFPVLWMTFIMLLFQNFCALYFFEPSRPGYVNTHSYYWLFFIGMLIYVGVKEYQEGHTDECDSDEESDHVPWKLWSIVLVAGFAIIVLGGSIINGERTMQSANTRWPIWIWRDGPFPGPNIPE